jgi:signal transduction histidine kinase/ligand-binding sensor domain-containing protein
MRKEGERNEALSIAETVESNVTACRRNAMSLRVISTALVLLVFARPVGAERLSITAYTSADGLAHYSVKKIVTDSRGFVWFATRRGLTRYDGQRFLTYGVQDGLPIPSVNHLLVTTRGTYWVATNGGGVCRLRTEAPHERLRGASSPLFTTCAAGETPDANRVNVLYEDRHGQVWAGSDGGLLRLVEGDSRVTLEPVPLDLPGRPDRAVQIWGFAEDRQGSLWLGTSWGLLRRAKSGATYRYRIEPARGSDNVWDVLVDDDNRIWIGHDTGLIVFKPDDLKPGRHAGRDRALRIASKRHSPRPALPATPGEAIRIHIVSGRSNEFVSALHRSSDGIIWIGGRHGLTRFDGNHLTSYESAQAVPHVAAIAGDARGDIWVTGVNGAMKLTRAGFVTYTADDGVPPRIRSFFESPSGDLLVNGWPSLRRFDGARFMPVPLNLPADRSVEMRAPVLQTRAGEWWVPGEAGLYRFPAVPALDDLGRVQPMAIYTTRDGLAGDDVALLFEDSIGNVWIGTWAPTRMVVTRWNRATERFDRFTESDGLPPFSRPLAIDEDRAGDVWVGFWNGGVARYRHGRFTLFTENDGAPPGPIGRLYTDTNGRLWLGASGGGLGRVDVPHAERPQFARYTMAQGLSSDHVTAITGDRSGRIYVGTLPVGGTMSSIDRLDPATGQVRYYTLPTGLEATEVDAAFRDRHGTLWFGAPGTLLSLAPSSDDASSPPAIYIGGVRVAGAPYAISALGETTVGGLQLKPTENQLEIEYFSVAARSAVRYQYRLEGADGDWSDPTAQHSIHYANLPPGRYRFTVRAIAADGEVSVQPASVAFQIGPPFWRQWWFVASGVMLVVLAAWGLHRVRVGRLLDLERVRTRIATDLHDDIGSSLTQIAILTEVAQRRMTERDPAIVESISRVSSISRELVDSMSEIVWAINPCNDRVQDLAARMRRFATDLLTSQDIGFHFCSPDPVIDMAMTAEKRRQSLLVFKEAIHNAVRHSRCTGISVELVLVGRSLVWTMSDNGRGFDPRQSSHGHGLRSMAARARAIGGRLEIASQPGRGTTVRFTVALDRGARLRCAARGTDRPVPSEFAAPFEPVSIDGTGASGS